MKLIIEGDNRYKVTASASQSLWCVYALMSVDPLSAITVTAGSRNLCGLSAERNPWLHSSRAVGTGRG